VGVGLDPDLQRHNVQHHVSGEAGELANHAWRTPVGVVLVIIGLQRHGIGTAGGSKQLERKVVYFGGIDALMERVSTAAGTPKVAQLDHNLAMREQLVASHPQANFVSINVRFA
jgi:hypothetical protein